MEIDPKDNDVFQLLKKLKEANGAYPQDLLSLRRQGYLKQVAEVGGGAGLALGLRNTLKSGRGAGLPPTAGTLLEGLLVVAIVAEASTVAYFYRSKVTEFFQNFTNTPKVETVANPPILTSPIPGLVISPTLSPDVTVTMTETATAISTPSLMAQDPTNPGDGQGSSSSGSSAVSTPNPNEDSGNHYGQTPKPDRTKEPDEGSGSQGDQSDPKKKK